MKKKLITIILSFVMVFSMTVPAFADSGSKVASFKNPVYTAWGDSLGAGCKTPGVKYQKRYEAYRTSPEKEKDWSVNAVPYTFVSKFASSINADVEHSYNGTQPGMRAKDYCYILGLISEDEFKYYNYDSNKAENQIDWWSSTNIASDQLGDLVKIKDKFVESIKNADIITIELGANDMTTFIVNDYSVIENILKTLMGGQTAITKAKITALIEAFKVLSKNYNQENLTKVLEGMCELKTEAALYEKLVADLANSLVKATQKTRCYWNKLMNYINKHKKPGAIVIATETPNFGRGLDLNLGMNLDITSIIQPFVNDKNAYIRLKAKKYNYVVADMDDVVMSSKFDEKSHDYDDDWSNIKKKEQGDRIATYSIHPNPDEHTKIYNSIRAAYDKKRTSRKVKAAVATTAVVTAATVKAIDSYNVK